MRKLRSSSSLFLLLIAVLTMVAGCGPFHSIQSRAAIATIPAPPPKMPEPPAICPEMEADSVPAFVQAAVENAAHTPEIDAVIQEAEDRFRAGEAFYKEGDLENARAQFDRSIEVLLDAPRDALDRGRVKGKCDELAGAIHAYDIEGLSASGHEPGFDTSPLDDVLSATFPLDPNIELNVTEELKLPVSELPLEINGEVMRYINYFSSKSGHKVLADGLQRAGRYRSMVQRILDEEGVPQELLYLAQAESGFKPRAMSRKRATGMWQFMSLRAREYGLQRSSFYDDRLDPEKATRAAARHLRDLYEQFGDWYLAIAAYNSGPSRINIAVRRTGYADFWELSRRRVLPRETRNYIPIILATTIMAKNPEQYGIEDVVPDPPVEYNTIEVTAATHMGLIAGVLGRPLQEIRELNPAILHDVAPAGYTVHIPKGAGNFVMGALETVPASRRAAWRVHRVGYGETLTEIAQLYQTTTERIAVANGGMLTIPETGDLLVIPVSYTKRTQPARSRSRTPAAKKKSTPKKSASAGKATTAKTG